MASLPCAWEAFLRPNMQWEYIDPEEVFETTELLDDNPDTVLVRTTRNLLGDSNVDSNSNA